MLRAAVAPVAVGIGGLAGGGAPARTGFELPGAARCRPISKGVAVLEGVAGWDAAGCAGLAGAAPDWSMSNGTAGKGGVAASGSAGRVAEGVPGAPGDMLKGA